MSRSVLETALGAFVLCGALIFLVFSYSKGDAGKVSGYEVIANFAKVGGLQVGDPVQVSGVKVGQVSSLTLDKETYLAKVTMEIDDSIKIPDDSSATINSQSLLGGMTVGIQPGASEEMLSSGGEIQYTQAPQNLEELLGKFIFSMQGDKKKENSPADPITSDAASSETHVTMPESP